MIKRVDDLKYTKQVVTKKLEKRNTQKRRILIRLVDALIDIVEDKEQFDGVLAYNKVDKRMLSIDIILDELKDDLIKLSKAKDIYNYLNNMTLKDIVLTFGDLIQFKIHAKKKKTKQQRKECKKAMDNTDDNYEKLYYLTDKSSEIFSNRLKLSEDERILKNVMYDITEWHPFDPSGGFTLRGLNLEWLY